MNVAYLTETQLLIQSTGIETPDHTIDGISELTVVSLNELDDFRERLYHGKVNEADFKQMFERCVYSDQALLDELSNNYTVSAIFEKAGQRFKSRYQSEPKSRVVRAYIDDVQHLFALGRAISFTVDFSGNQLENRRLNALRVLVAQTDDKVLSAFVENHNANHAAYQAKVEAMLDALKDPKSLSDFEMFFKYKTIDALSDSQLALYDALVLENCRANQRETPDSLDAFSEGETAKTHEIVETQHTKLGHAIFVVQLQDRVEADYFNAMKKIASSLDGYYSSYRGNGAIPGFIFKSRTNAEAFKSVLEGDVTTAEEAIEACVNQHTTQKVLSRRDRLLELAATLEAKANETLAVDRLANTARRAASASRIESRANYDLRLVQTLRNIADKVDDPAFYFPKRIYNRAQVIELDQYLYRAHYNETRSRVQHEDGSFSERERLCLAAEVPTEITVRFAEYPYYEGYRSDFNRLGRDLLEVTGAKQMGNALIKLSEDMSKAYDGFLKKNWQSVILSLSTGLPAVFSSYEEAERIRKRSSFKNKMITAKIKKGENAIVLSAAEAIAQKIWDGPNDTIVRITPSFACDVIAKVNEYNRRAQAKIQLPYRLELTWEKRKRLESIGITSESLLRSALREYIRLQAQHKEIDKVTQLIRALAGKRNVGIDFFPTPYSTAMDLVESADLREGLDICEPEAGSGNIADLIREAGFEPDVIELSSTLRDILEAKGYSVIAHDFLVFQEKQYDRIIMNPPFSNGADILHVYHAYSLLKPEGRLVAIVGEGAFSRSDAQAKAFRNWLAEVGAEDEKLPAGTFLDRSLAVTTGANARRVIINKV